MLKDYLLDKQISIYKLSEMSNVPYTTLNELINGKKNVNECKIKTIESIAESLNFSIETLLNYLKTSDIKLSNSWEEKKNKKFYFPIIVNNENYQCNMIHPMKQKQVNDIYNYVKNNNCIEKVIIFGSAVNIRCNKKSDLDIAIKIKSECFDKENQNIISELIQEICNYNSDIIWLNTLDLKSKLYNNINLKGVKIYEQIIS